MNDGDDIWIRTNSKILFNLAIFGNGKSSEEKRISGEHSNFNRLFGINKIQKHGH